MNKLDVKKTTNDFGFEYLGIFIDDIPLDIYLFEVTSIEMLKGLMPAWFVELNSISEQEYVSECLSVESTDGVVIPILLCPEDMDFLCTVIVVKVRYTEESVIWDKVGIVKKDNWDIECWANSGIRNFEKWTDEEWKQYGSYFDLFNLNDWRWGDWISENWHKEEKRRILNYTHDYLNNNENIGWFENVPVLVFNKEDYKNIIRKK
ncbi:hypothetical protein [Acetivibrio cellulolyticus]|uniref:hypothetical protein n=1 Tax=Acetivibrio cellulolyticus TaxID=35830 RepID=UPI0001E2D1A9|nr:hypothetical protein [Acetivibrio cellulolyticus]